MNKTIWTSSVAALIVSLSAVCHADSVAPPGADSDSQASYSAGALYNLGNSYAHQAKPALAVLAYERARMLAPLDPDIRANLRTVRESVGLPPDTSSFSDHFEWFSPNATYWVGLVGLLLAGVGWVQLNLHKSYRIASRVTLGAGLLLVVFTVGDAIAIESLMDRSVVLQTVSASASPTQGAGTIFTISQAAVVRRRDEHGDFTLIQDFQGNIGWVPRGLLMPITTSQGDSHATI